MPVVFNKMEYLAESGSIFYIYIVLERAEIRWHRERISSLVRIVGLRIFCFGRETI